MSEDQIAKPANAKERVSPDRADDAPAPVHVEARESFHQEASVTQQAASTEIARSITLATPAKMRILWSIWTCVV